MAWPAEILCNFMKLATSGSVFTSLVELVLLLHSPHNLISSSAHLSVVRGHVEL